MTRTLHRQVLHGTVKADRLKVTLERLLEEGQVTVTEAPREPGKSGRTGRLWSVVEQSDTPARSARARWTG